MTTGLNAAVDWPASVVEHPARLASWRALNALVTKN